MSNKNIELIELTKELKISFSKGMEIFREQLNVDIPEKWPEFPQAFTLRPDTSDGQTNWPGYLFIDRSINSLIGNGGFSGSITPDGHVEIGYEVAPNFRNLGYATMAVKILLEYAFNNPNVTKVIAHTLATENASNAVLKKIGFLFEKEVPNEKLGVIWRWSKNKA